MHVGLSLHPSDYPFDVPDGSYVWSAATVPSAGTVASGGTVSALPSPLSPVLRGRIPVIAIGSNAAPSQLTRKYADARFADAGRPDGLIPVTTASVRDVDVVHAAHLALYGSIPATVTRSAGCTAHVHLTWLTPLQLDRMDETEGVGRRHHVCELPGIAGVGLEGERARCYVSDVGVLQRNARPLGLRAVIVDGSDVPRVTQTELWDLLATDSGLAVDGTTLLRAVIGDATVRATVADLLLSTAAPDGLDAQRLASHSSMSRIISQASISKPVYGPD